MSENQNDTGIDLLAPVLTEKFGIERADVSAQTPLESLGLDSLALVELFLLIQKRWGVVIEAGDVTAEDTVGALAKRFADGL